MLPECRGNSRRKAPRIVTNSSTNRGLAFHPFAVAPFFPLPSFASRRVRFPFSCCVFLNAVSLSETRLLSFDSSLPFLCSVCTQTCIRPPPFALLEFFHAHMYLRMTRMRKKGTAIKASLLFLCSATILLPLSVRTRVADEYAGKIFQAKFHFVFFFVGFRVLLFPLSSRASELDATLLPTGRGARAQVRRVNKGASTNSTYVIAMRGSLFHRFYDPSPPFRIRRRRYQNKMHKQLHNFRLSSIPSGRAGNNEP